MGSGHDDSPTAGRDGRRHGGIPWPSGPDTSGAAAPWSVAHPCEARDVASWMPTIGARMLDLFWTSVIAVVLLLDGPRLVAATERRVPARSRRQFGRLREVSHREHDQRGAAHEPADLRHTLLAALAGGAAAGVIGAVVLTPLVGVVRVVLIERRQADFPGATVATVAGDGPSPDRRGEDELLVAGGSAAVISSRR